MNKVVVLQHRLLHYRTALFEQLRTSCAERGIELHLVHGQATQREQAKDDEGSLPWAHKVANRAWQVGDRDLIWQPFPQQLRDADLVLVMQESRLLSNYPLLLKRLFTGPKVAYWGHGANLQSHAPDGLRERWKRLALTRVDWWFAYTQSTVDIVRAAGFPAERTTQLDNTIDTRGFQRDLAAITDADLAPAKHALGIGSGAPVGIFCGSLYPDKRLEFLVEAADRIHAQAPAFHCVVIGDGPSMPYLRDKTTLRPWLHLLGAKKGPERALYFRLANFMLNPGTVGLHIVDAFCSGLVLFTTSGGRHSPEIAYLRRGENAFMTADSTEEYAATVLGLLSDPAHFSRVKAAALADAERYTLDNMVRRFTDGIAQCLAVPKRR
jgi:glycosyltransferase involved in cell wall biosynthesis